MWGNKTVTIFFPCKNEAENIQHVVEEAKNLCSNGTPVFDEIIVVDNNCTDDTAKIARRCGAIVVEESIQGYGAAMRKGLLTSNSDIIISCEPDGTFIISDAIKLLSYSEDFSIVCGTRTTQHMIWTNANMKLLNRNANTILAKFIELLYGTNSMSDCGCTFRLIHKDSLSKIRDLFSTYKSNFLPDMIISSVIAKISFVEIPVNYRERVGDSKITGTFKGQIKTGLSMLFLALRRWPSFLKSKLLS